MQAAMERTRVSTPLHAIADPDAAAEAAAEVAAAVLHWQQFWRHSLAVWQKNVHQPWPLALHA